MLKQTFLGIDPGLNNTGWGIVECTNIIKDTKNCVEENTDYVNNNNYKLIDYGIFKTDLSDSLEMRLNFIFDSIFNLIKAKKPDRISMERVFVNINPASSEKLIMARTASFLAIARAGYNVIEFSPNEVKKAITSNGRSSKDIVKSKVQQILNIKEKIKKSDATDALAIAMCIGLIKHDVKK